MCLLMAAKPPIKFNRHQNPRRPNPNSALLKRSSASIQKVHSDTFFPAEQGSVKLNVGFSELGLSLSYTTYSVFSNALKRTTETAAEGAPSHQPIGASPQLPFMIGR